MSSPDTAALNLKLEMLHDDVGEIKTALGKLSDAIVKLALIEERQAVANASLERAFATLERVESRVSALEQSNVSTSRTSSWIDRLLTAGIGVLFVVLLKALNIL